jgi:hypothetical protein
MDEKTQADGVPEPQDSVEPTQAVPGLSAEVTSVQDPLTSVENAPAEPLSAGQMPTIDAGGSDPAPDKGLTFLQPGTRPDSLGRLGHYEVLQLLGKGGFGIVLKAFDENLQRTVAIKVLGPHLAGNAVARTRFVREARAAAAVNSKHVVGTYEVNEQPIPYLVMEHVAGTTLQERIDRTGPLPTRDVLRIGAEIAEGLSAAHQRGLIHRDIKPGNILLEEADGEGARVKIADFGLARAVDDATLTQSGVIAGTPHYMSPEQARGDALDHRSDLFSLGSVLYTMCTGQPPFRAHKTLGVLKRVCDDAPKPIREINPAVPDALTAVVNMLHVKDPAGRFQSAGAVAELLSQHLAHLDDPSLPAPPALPGESAEHPGAVAPPAKRPRSRRKLVLGLVAACALAVIFGSLLPLSGRDVRTGRAAVAAPPRLLAVLRGEAEPADNAERLELARLAYDNRYYAGAARLWADAMANDAKLADDRQAGVRYDAARAAALASDGVGRDEPPPDDDAKTMFRHQAYGWLTAELTAWGKLFQSSPERDRPAIVAKVSDWARDDDFAGVRGTAALAKLPDGERKAFARFWAEVGDAETFLALQSGAPPLLKTAAVQAWFGQDDALAATRDRALRFAKDTTDPTTAERTAKICCLSPADDATDEAALVLARRAVDLGKQHVWLVYFQMCLGMAEYRCGHYAEADAALLEAARLGRNNPMVSRTTPFYQVMSLFRQGRDAEARKRMAEAGAPPLPADPKAIRVDNVSADDLILWLAYKEARALLEGSAGESAARP